MTNNTKAIILALVASVSGVTMNVLLKISQFPIKFKSLKCSFKQYEDKKFASGKSINTYLHFNFLEYKLVAGGYCESVIPDPIPNSEVKPFSADGTLS